MEFKSEEELRKKAQQLRHQGKYVLCAFCNISLDNKRLNRLRDVTLPGAPSMPFAYSVLSYMNGTTNEITHVEWVEFEDDDYIYRKQYLCIK
jgi:hypothetical protein